MKAVHKLDCVGLYCPMPIYETSKKIEELKTGEVLEVIADDVGIKKDMPKRPKRVNPATIQRFTEGEHRSDNNLAIRGVIRPSMAVPAPMIPNRASGN